MSVNFSIDWTTCNSVEEELLNYDKNANDSIKDKMYDLLQSYAQYGDDVEAKLQKLISDNRESLDIEYSEVNKINKTKKIILALFIFSIVLFLFQNSILSLFLLIPLLIGFISIKIKYNKAKTIYDVHENAVISELNKLQNDLDDYCIEKYNYADSLYLNSLSLEQKELVLMRREAQKQRDEMAKMQEHMVRQQNMLADYQRRLNEQQKDISNMQREVLDYQRREEDRRNGYY